jgi:hypothetical protein|tara:strand:+ start:82 stop:273 length:192 start_codon:yes stop_codon:yes gene_type:complete
MKCIHCKSDNNENWFYCRNCGKKASEKKFPTKMWMMSDIGKRTDIEFGTTTIEESVKRMRSNA